MHFQWTDELARKAEKKLQTGRLTQQGEFLLRAAIDQQKTKLVQRLLEPRNILPSASEMVELLADVVE